MTTAELKQACEQLDSQMRGLRVDSDEYQALLAESNRLWEERQKQLKAERKALREQIKALQRRVDELNEEIW
jgi:SMC interacting uncharacterized protein involved in chromosome segregation